MLTQGEVNSPCVRTRYPQPSKPQLVAMATQPVQNRNALYHIFKQTALYEKMLRWAWLQETRIREEEKRIFTREAREQFGKGGELAFPVRG